MFQNRAQLLTKRCAGPASSPGRCTCGLALPLLVTFPTTGFEGSLQEAGLGDGGALLFQTPETDASQLLLERLGVDLKLTLASPGSAGILGNQRKPECPFSGTFSTLKPIVSSEGRIMAIFHADT